MPHARSIMIVLSVCVVVSTDAAFAVADPYLGEVITLGTNFCPTGFLPMNGQLLDIGDYEDLFNLIGTRYGGNGQMNFALPMMPPTVTATGEPVLFCIATFGIYPSVE